MQKLVLRDYQTELINAASNAMRSNKCVLIQLPTGGGKTIVASEIVQRAVNRGKRVYFICHRQELLRQTSLTFRKFGINHSFIAAGLGYNPQLLMQICSIDTLRGRMSAVPKPDLIIIDEAHHATSNSYKKCFEEWEGSFFTGLTATPVRTDGAGMGDAFDAMVQGPQVADLIEHGSLSPYKMFVPAGGMDVTGVKKRAGDFIASEIEAKIDRPKLVGDILTHWRKHAGGMLTIGFAPSLDFSIYMVQQFNAAGIPSAHLDGTTPRDEREAIIKRFAAGEIRVLWNRFLFGEGFDLAAIAQRDVTIGCVIDAAPTQSLSLTMQRWGRALRPSPGKTAIILDHAANCFRHGFPDDVREWTLKGADKSERKNDKDDGTAPIICEGCYNAIKRPAPPCCPYCGKELRKEVKPLEVGEGELQEADNKRMAEIRAKRKQEEKEAKTLEDFLKIQRERGYKHGWAYQRMHARARQ